MNDATKKQVKDKATQRRNDDSTSRLFAHNPQAHALMKEGKKLAREARRRKWYEQHKDDK